jgi:hypothetical protein
MSPAIEFHCQLRPRAVEIEEVAPARILAAEFELVEAAVTKQAPQTLFGFGGFFTQAAGEVAGRGGASAMAGELPPHPNPLPRWGRGDLNAVAFIVHRRCWVSGEWLWLAECPLTSILSPDGGEEEESIAGALGGIARWVSHEPLVSQIGPSVPFAISLAPIGGEGWGEGAGAGLGNEPRILGCLTVSPPYPAR